MKLVFFLRHFNDIDHNAGIMWHCLEQNDHICAILLDRNYDIEDDVRIQFLREYRNFRIDYVDSFLNMARLSNLFRLSKPDGTSPQSLISTIIRKGLQVVGGIQERASTALNEIDPRACIFEWGSPYRMSHREFFEAATNLNIPTLCFPHGLNIYMNEDITPGRKRAFERNRQTMTSRNEYDAYVTQSEHDRRQEAKLGVNSERHYVLGSSRYYPEWQSINEGLYPEYHTQKDILGKLSVVFMLPHWRYNVNKEKTIKLISNLADCKWIYLVIKEHTRGDSLPEDVYDQLTQKEDCELVAQVPSVSLIKWADAIINFGSSIGIEALQQNTHHINPSYLHSNTTIFDTTGASHRPTTNKKTVSLLEKIHNEQVNTSRESNKKQLYQAVIYGGDESHDVLERYRELIKRLSRPKFNASDNHT